MAMPSTIYRAGIQLSDINRNIYESLQATVARHPSETAERLVARLLAFALFYQPDMAFTKGISAGDEPDLWVKGPDGRVLLWIEVGLPEPDRLIKASRHVEQAILFACGPSLPRWTEQHLAKFTGSSNLTILGIDQGFLNKLVTHLERSITWDFTITENSIYLNVGSETLETTLTHLSGPPL